MSEVNRNRVPKWVQYCLTLSGPQPDFSGDAIGITTRPITEFYSKLDAVKVPISEMAASLFPWQLNFHNNIYSSILYSLHTHRIWKRSVEKYKRYRTFE